MHRRSRTLAGRRGLAGALIGCAITAAACTSRDDGTFAAQACAPVETRRPNAPEQRPAFAEQTRACALTSQVAFDVVSLAGDLEHPWAVEPLPDGALLVTERPGRMRIVSPGGETGPPIDGLPPVDARGQGGLLDVALSPSFPADAMIYWSYAEPRQGGNGTTVARGVLTGDRTRLEQVEVIFRAMPTYAGVLHFGSRLAFGPDGWLFVTLGERSDLVTRPQAQHLDSHLGKIVRLHPDGQIPADNPFVDTADARGEIWSAGHRNIQAAAFDDDGRLWIVEHGAQGGDELNLVQRGRNYGWPLVAFGEEYSGRPIPGAVTEHPDYESPVYYWDPVIAPSGAVFYTGDAFPEWRGSLFIGALAQRRLVRLEIEHDRVTGEEHLLIDRGRRVRDIAQGPDGMLYLVTDEARGELLKIVPRR